MANIPHHRCTKLSSQAAHHYLGPKSCGRREHRRGGVNNAPALARLLTVEDEEWVMAGITTLSAPLVAWS